MRVGPPCIAALFLAVASSGCLVGERPVGGDADGDSLADPLELAGWDLSVQAAVASCGHATARPPPVGRTVTSDPNLTDTDGDGVTDAEELQWSGDPRVNDTDGDGLTDLEETRLNTASPRPFFSFLKLNDADTDGDCLSDSAEVRGFDVPGIGHRSTDPTLNDTDHDGLSDVNEVRVRETDPASADTDRDGARDGSDEDPLHNLGLTLAFDRFTLKDGPANASVAFNYTFTTHGGVLWSSRPPRIAAPLGQTIELPANASPPARVDVEDGTAGLHLRFDFWVVRADTGQVIALEPHAPDAIVRVVVDGAHRTWQTAGNFTHAADGSIAVLESPEARLELRLAVDHL